MAQHAVVGRIRTALVAFAHAMKRPVYAQSEGTQALGNPVVGRALSLPLWVLPLTVFVTGPVTLWATYAFMRLAGTVEGRPLIEFMSATLGDLLLLPIIVTLCALSMGDLGRLGVGRLSGWVRWLPVSWAVLSTVGLNFVWLSDAGNANWTQPLVKDPTWLPLSFNTAGWLHAAFFVLIQWWIAEFVVRFAGALWLLRKGSKIELAAPDEHLSALLVRINGLLSTALVFGLLLAFDYWERIVTPSIEQTWVWLLVPGVVLVIGAVSNTVLFEHLDTLANTSALVYRREGAALLVWAVPLLVASAIVLVAVLPGVWARLGLLTVSSVALAAYAPYNVWAEAYQFQRGRRADGLAYVVLATIGLLMLAGFALSLHMVLAQPPVAAIGEIVGPWLLALLVAMAGAAGGAGLGVMLANREAHHPDWPPTDCAVSQRRMSSHFGPESPQHDILQNVAQYGLLHGLLPMFAAAYVYQAIPLLQRLELADQLSTHISLMFGYAGVVVAAVTFPLYNNMQYVRDLQQELKKLPKEAGECDVREYLKADRDFTTFLCIAVGVIAALGAMWMWVQVLDSILASV